MAYTHTFTLTPHIQNVGIEIAPTTASSNKKNMTMAAMANNSNNNNGVDDDGAILYISVYKSKSRNYHEICLAHSVLIAIALIAWHCRHSRHHRRRRRRRCRTLPPKRHKDRKEKRNFKTPTKELSAWCAALLTYSTGSTQKQKQHQQQQQHLWHAIPK